MSTLDRSASSHAGGAEQATCARIVTYVACGGAGKRLWPLSRQDRPKQFHDLAGAGSMLTVTLRRAAARTGGGVEVRVIGAARHGDLIRASLAEAGMPEAAVILEPFGRETAAVAAIAAADALAQGGDTLILLAASDHAISTEARFWETVELGVPAALGGRIVLFGIRPERAETGFGHIEVADAGEGPLRDVVRFMAMPDPAALAGCLASDRFFWNSGIFLFRADVMCRAFRELAPDIWKQAGAALQVARRQAPDVHLAASAYSAILPRSFESAVLERMEGLVMVPATFEWSDLGSWRALHENSSRDGDGNLINGDVLALDCRNSLLAGGGRLVAAIGVEEMAVICTSDAVLVAPLDRSQQVKDAVERLERSNRTEIRITPTPGRISVPGALCGRAARWLFEEALPRWAGEGVDRAHGGFHEALAPDGSPAGLPRRLRTMARQVYSFAAARRRGWRGPDLDPVAHGIEFIASRARSPRGGWVRVLEPDGTVADPAEDLYDHACMLLALAEAAGAGNGDAASLGRKTLAAIDRLIEERRAGAPMPEQCASAPGLWRTDTDLHLLEAMLAWYGATGDGACLERAAAMIDLFEDRFFDAGSWTVAEFLRPGWLPASGRMDEWTNPGHHFGWASLLVQFAELAGRPELVAIARKLHASAVANGFNPATGLAWGAVSRDGLPLQRVSRSWPQAEAVKSAIALDRAGRPDRGPEIEERLGRLFAWHLDPAPPGLWLDRIDEHGRPVAGPVPASILYHLVSCLTAYLDWVDEGASKGALP